MQKIIGVTDLQRRFRSVFEEVARQRVPYVLTRDSRPEAALIPYEDFVRFQKWQEDEILARFDALATRLAEQSKQVDDAHVTEDVETAIRETRR
jgi:prevent-host-death family protein